MAIEKLRAYCDKILPTVYDDSMSYYEVLCQLAERVDEIETTEGILTVNEVEAVDRNVTLTSTEIPNDSDVTGESITEALNSLLGEIETLESRIEALKGGA